MWYFQSSFSDCGFPGWRWTFALWFMHLLNCAELVEGSYVIVARGLRHFLFKRTYSSLSVLLGPFYCRPAPRRCSTRPRLSLWHHQHTGSLLIPYSTYHVTWGVTSRHQVLWRTHTPGKEVFKELSVNNNLINEKDTLSVKNVDIPICIS